MPAVFMDCQISQLLLSKELCDLLMALFKSKCTSCFAIQILFHLSLLQVATESELLAVWPFQAASMSAL